MVQTYVSSRILVWDWTSHAIAIWHKLSGGGGLTAQSYEDPQHSRWPKERTAVRSAPEQIAEKH